MEEDTPVNVERAADAALTYPGAVDVARLARLAMIDVSSEALAAYARDLEAILVRLRAALGPFSGSDADLAGRDPPVQLGVPNALRADRPRPDGIAREAIVATFPRHDGQRALGPRIHD